MNQRKKWIHFFESVTAVFFFASLTGYCEMLEEDTTLVSYHLIPKRSIPYVVTLQTAPSKGLCKVKKFKKSEITMEVGGWVQVSLGFFLENCPKIALNQNLDFGIVYHVYSVYTLLKMVGYYDLSVLSMSVMVSKNWMVGGWVG